MYKVLSAAALSLSVAACASFKGAEQDPTAISYKVDGEKVTLTATDSRFGTHETTCKDVKGLAEFYGASEKLSTLMADWAAESFVKAGYSEETGKQFGHNMINAIKGAALECGRN